MYYEWYFPLSLKKAKIPTVNKAGKAINAKPHPGVFFPVLGS